jgi:hypothetical protein
MGKTSSKRILKVVVKCMADEDADSSYLEQEGFEDRMRQYRDGQFNFVGIAAEAVILLHPVNESRHVMLDAAAPIQTINSGGLWGIENDSDASYLKEIQDEQLSELRDQLRAIGFSTRAISKAFENVEHVS